MQLIRISTGSDGPHPASYHILIILPDQYLWKQLHRGLIQSERLLSLLAVWGRDQARDGDPDGPSQRFCHFNVILANRFETTVLGGR